MTDTPTPRDASTPPSSRSSSPSSVPAPDANIPFLRTVKSYVLRAGRTTVAQAKAYETVGPKYLVPYSGQALDLAQAFGRDAPTVLEIGFGMGEATAHIASIRPDTNFLCCEVHEAGVGALLKRIADQGLENIRILRHDAVEVIDHMLPHGVLSGVHIFFPDPWHKTRHHKRRLIQPALVEKLADRLARGGYLHCATDWQAYAEQMMEVIGAEPKLRNSVAQTSSTDGYAVKPDYRPLTKFENRGLKLGHGVWDLVFLRA